MTDNCQVGSEVPVDVDLLETAVAAGYYDVPRQASLVDIAAAEGIDSCEASERLRMTLCVLLGRLFSRPTDRAALPAAGDLDPGLVELLATGTTDRLPSAEGSTGVTPSTAVARALAGTDTRTPPDDGAPSPSVYRALAVPERRQVLRYLQGVADAEVDELVDVLTGWYAARDGPVGPDERAPIGTALREHHLPILERAGLVEYDGTVRLAALDPAVASLLDPDPDSESGADATVAVEQSTSDQTPPDA